MFDIYILLYIIWFCWILKYALFWLYLWQLKDYHIGRFIDHFRTEKGRKLIFSPAQIIKLVLLPLLLFGAGLSVHALYILILVYFVQLLAGIVKKSVRKPIFTYKIIFLTVISLTLVLASLILAVISGSAHKLGVLLIFDLALPLTISAVVLIFQPFSVLVRNNTLKKAERKIQEIKSGGRIKVIAITGSYGKTTTKEFLSTILSRKYKVLSTKEHQNSEIGVAGCILDNLTKECDVFIAEIGAYNRGKIKEVCSVIKPDIGIVTGVNEQHLALFGSIENLLSAEGGVEMANSLPDSGLLVVNGDNKYCINLYKNFNKEKRIYSLSNKTINSDIWADSVTLHEQDVSFLAIDKSGQMAHFGAKVLGRQNIQNLLGAILTAKELGMSFGEISEALGDIKQEQGGLAIRQEKHGIKIIDSSYSANPDGVFADLDYLSMFNGKKIIIMPCLIELGKKSPEVHEKIGEKIGQICDLAIITTKDYLRDIEKGVSVHNESAKTDRLIFCDKPKDIYSMVMLLCKSGDTVLLEGRVPAEVISLFSK